MKKLITTIAIGAFAFLGTATESDARPNRGGYGHQAPASHVYVSGYRHGRPVYTEKYFIGYDRYGRPRFAYRTISAPRRGHGHHGRGYDCNYDRNYDQNYYNNRSSGARVSFSFGG